MGVGISGRRPWRPKRELEQEDYEMMNLPARYRDVTLEGIYGEYEDPKTGEVCKNPLKDAVVKYHERLAEMRQRGLGLLAYGNNGIGKTCALSWLLQEFRAHGQSALFTKSEDLRKASIEGKRLTDDYELWDWSQHVDVLLIDEIGKEYVKSGGSKSNGYDFTVTELHHLIRHRYDRKLVTLISTNLYPAKISERFPKSMMAILKNALMAVEAKGIDRRVVQAEKDWTFLAG